MVLFCIDDDPEDIELFIDAVRVIDRSYTCLTAVDGYEALRKLAIMVPDYIFLDINMPGMNGRETLEHIRRDDRLNEVPIYILSTSKDLREAASCLQLGATKWIVKPSTFGELVNGLKDVLS
ncbi:MAG TPA: response regulator [Cyclobacteriaceae bacterium]